MNVGQVEFSVKADNLDATLKKAEQLQTVLNSIDGRKIAAGASRAIAQATKEEEKAVKSAENADKEYARIYHKSSEQRIKESLNTNKRIAKDNEKALKEAEKESQEYAKIYHKTSEQRIQESLKTNKRIAQNDKQTRENGKKLMQSWLNEASNEEKEYREGLHKFYKDSENAYKKSVKQISKEKKLSAAVAKEQQKQATEIANKPKEYRRNTQTMLVNAGAQMQTLGSAMQRLTAPFTNVYRGLTMGIGYRMLYKVMDSVNGAFSRYDTIETYAKVLTKAGIDATKKFSVAGAEATDVYHNLENAVLGLPTGIDEIVESMRRYATASGDVERATKLAIAANNAYISGNMEAREKLFTERQLRGLIGGKQLTPQQWDSLARNASSAMRVVADDMGMSVNEMTEKLKQGTISGKEFLNVFIKAGTEGKIAKSAQVMKQTWESVSQNFQNRMNAMGEGILKTLDEVFKKTDGRTFLQHALGIDKKGNYIGGGIRGIIDDMSKSAQDWIKAHPESITNFFENLSKIDWQGIVGGFAKFALTMGRFYAFLGKIVGSGKLVQAMLWINTAGKVIQTIGGFTKGTAGIVAWIATLKKFGSSGRAIKNGAELAKGHGAIVGATKTVATAALTWQQVASKAVTVAAIPAMAWAFKEVSLGMQELTKVDFSKLSVGKVAAAAGIITAFTGLAAALGHLTAGNVIGWITTAGTAIGIAEVAAISKTMKWVGEGLNSIADAKLPSTDKIKSVMLKLNEVSKYFKSVNPFEAIGKIFDAWTKSAEFKAVKNATDAFKGISDMVNLKLPKGWSDKATERFGKVTDFVSNIESMVVDLDEKLLERSKKNKNKWGGSQKGTSKAKASGNSYSYIKEQLRDFAAQMQSISDGMGYMVSALQYVKKFNIVYANLNRMKNGNIEPFDFDAVFYRVHRFAEEIYKFAKPAEGDEMSTFEMLNKAAQQLESGNFAKIGELFNKIPEIIKSVSNVYKKVLKSKMLSGEPDSTGNRNMADPLAILTQRLEPLFKAINAINTKVPEDISGLKRLKRIQTALNRIPAVINQLVNITNNANVGNINVETIQSIVTKITDALAAFDALNGKKVDLDIKITGNVDNQATGEINKAYRSVKRALNRFDKLDTDKVVDVNVSANITGVDATVQAINSAVDRISAALGKLSIARGGVVTGGFGHHHNGGRMRPLYRAHGGSIFNSRGTDTIPAMLTKGEYVINRMAASRIGDAALWRLNHMDISGALQALSARVGQSIVPRNSVINNTTNNTHNTHVDIHNAAGAGVGLGRANRWVRGI